MIFYVCVASQSHSRRSVGILTSHSEFASTVEAHDANYDGVTGHMMLTSLTGTHLRSHFGSMSKAEMRCALVSSLAVAPIAAYQSNTRLHP